MRMIDDIEKNKFVRAFLDGVRDGSDSDEFYMDDYYNLVDKFRKLNNDQKLYAILDILILKASLLPF